MSPTGGITLGQHRAYVIAPPAQPPPVQHLHFVSRCALHFVWIAGGKKAACLNNATFKCWTYSAKGSFSYQYSSLFYVEICIKIILRLDGWGGKKKNNLSVYILLQWLQG